MICHVTQLKQIINIENEVKQNSIKPLFFFMYSFYCWHQKWKNVPVWYTVLVYNLLLFKWLLSLLDVVMIDWNCGELDGCHKMESVASKSSVTFWVPCFYWTGGLNMLILVINHQNNYNKLASLLILLMEKSRTEVHPLDFEGHLQGTHSSGWPLLVGMIGCKPSAYLQVGNWTLHADLIQDLSCTV